MLEYGQPIIVALIIFAVIAVLSFLPWLVYIYRKLGYFPVSSTLIIFSFIFYFLAAFLLTLLPLPETRSNCIVQPGGRNYYSLVPFQFVKDLLRETNVAWSSPATYVYLLKERAFFQAFFNLLLLMPFGVYLRYFFQARSAWWKALLLTFAVTLMYEVTQVTGIYGLYACPYRLFDVDDLMLNTVGGFLGFFIAPILLNIFPTRASVQEKADQLLKKDEVRNMPILIAMLLDLCLVHISSGIIAGLTNSWDIWSMFIIKTIMLAVFLVVIPFVRNGHTLGSQFMRFRFSGSRLRRKLIKRMLAVFLIYAIAFVAQVLGSSEAEFDSELYALSIILNLLGWLISFLLFVVLVIHAIIVLVSKEQRHFFFDGYATIGTTRKAASTPNAPIFEESSDRGESSADGRTGDDRGAGDDGQTRADKQHPTISDKS